MYILLRNLILSLLLMFLQSGRTYPKQITFTHENMAVTHSLR